MAIEITNYTNYNTSKIHSAQTSKYYNKTATILQNFILKKYRNNYIIQRN